MAKRMAAAGTKPTDYEAQIAEAAYYKAERRGFAPGSEMDDWLEAKREIDAVMAKPKATRKKATKKTAAKATATKKAAAKA